MKSREANAVRASLSRSKAFQRKCIDLANDIGGLSWIFCLRLPARINRASLAPLVTDANTGFVDMPVQPAPVAVIAIAFGDLGYELLDPAENRRPIHGDPMFGQKVAEILIAERKPAVSSNGQQDDFPWESVPFEQIAAHAMPLCLYGWNAGKTCWS